MGASLTEEPTLDDTQLEVPALPGEYTELRDGQIYDMVTADYAITELTEEEKQAFVNLYTDVFVFETVPLDDTPGKYDDYALALRADLIDRLLARVKADPGFAAQMDPAVAGPQLGLSSPETPLIGNDGAIVNQERVDEMYRFILYGLVFDREGFMQTVKEMAEELMPLEQPPEEPSMDPMSEPQSERDNAIRQEVASVPIRHWANQLENPIMPPAFVDETPVLSEAGDNPEHFQRSFEPLELPEFPATPSPDAVDMPALPSPEALIAGVDFPVPEVPELVPEPADLPSLVPNSPFSVVAPELWNDPSFSLPLPDLLDFLRQLAELSDDTLHRLLGGLDKTTALPERIRGTLEEAFPEVFDRVVALDVAIDGFGAGIKPVRAPHIVLDHLGLPLPDELDALILELEQELTQLNYVGHVNGVDFEGTYGVPEAVDIDGDNQADLIIEMVIEPAVVAAQHGLADLNARLIVQRANAATPVIPDLPTLSLARASGLRGAENTVDQLMVAGVATETAVLPVPDLPEFEAAFPYDLTIAFYPPDSDALVIHEIGVQGGADAISLTLQDLGPSIDLTATAASGPFSSLTSVLHDADAAGDVATILVEGDEFIGRVAASANLDPADEVSDLSVTPIVPADLDVSARRDNDGGSRAIVLSSEMMSVMEVTNEAERIELDNVAGAAFALSIQDIDPNDPDRFAQQGLLVSDLPDSTEVDLTVDGIAFETSARGADVDAIAGTVDDGDFLHATWARVEGASRDFTVETPSTGIRFDSEYNVDLVRATVARTAAAVLDGEIASGFKVTDDLTAFGLPGAISAGVTPTGDGGFDIQSDTNVDTDFVIDAERNTADGLESEEFWFSNLPQSLSAEVGDGSVNLGGNAMIDSITGDISRPLDGPLVDPTQGIVLMDGLDGRASIGMDAANVNIQNVGSLADGNVLASNKIDPLSGNTEFLGLTGNHMLGDVVGDVHQHSARLTGVASHLVDEVGGVAMALVEEITGLGTEVLGTIDVNLGLGGPLCWSISMDSDTSLELCLSNIPDSISIELALFPTLSITYVASEEIDEITLHLVGPDADILFYIRGIPEVISFIFTRAGIDVVMSDRLDAIGLVATIEDTTIAFGLESIPRILRFRWGEDGMEPGQDEEVDDGAIGRVFATISRPGLHIFGEIVHLPAAQFSWESGAFELDMGGDAIESLTLQLLLEPAGQPDARLELLFQALHIPGIAASWGDGGGTLSTDGVFDLISLQLILGQVIDPVLSLLLEIEDIPEIAGASWTDGSFDLAFEPPGARIGRVTFQFIADDLTLFLEALGIPGISANFGDAGGSISTDGPLDSIHAYFRKGVTAPSFLIDLIIKGVPQLQDLSFDQGINLAFVDGSIDLIRLEFFADLVDDDLDIYFLVEARGVPGFAFNPTDRTFTTQGVLDELHLLLRRGAVATPILLAELTIRGVPQIAASWADGLDFGFVPEEARIEEISLTFLSDDQTGNAGDLIVTLEALGVPGIAFDTEAGTISTSGVLDQLHLRFELGGHTPPAPPTILVDFEVLGVPKISAGLFGDGGFNLAFEPVDAQIVSMDLLFQIEQVIFGCSTCAPVIEQTQILLDTDGLPGIEIAMGDGGGTIGTAAELDKIHLHFHTGVKGQPVVVANLRVEGVPKINAGLWGDDLFSLDLVDEDGSPGDIDLIQLEFIVDLSGTSQDLYFVLQATYVPGITLGFGDGGGTIGTSAPLGSIELRAMIGPRTAYSINDDANIGLAGPGLFLKLGIYEVPQITVGSGWVAGDDLSSIDLGLTGNNRLGDPRIDSIVFEFILDAVDSSLDIYLRLLSEGIPGIGLGFGELGGTIYTTGEWDLVQVIAILGPRSGVTLAGNGVYALIEAVGIPQVQVGSGWTDSEMELQLGSEKIDRITLEFFVNEQITANDLFLFAEILGIPTTTLSKNDDGFSLTAANGLDEAKVIFRKGIYSYNPDLFPDNIFVGALLRPDGYGTYWPGIPQFGISAKVSDVTGVTWSTDEATDTQSLAIGFAEDTSLRAILDFQSTLLTAKVDASIVNLPAQVNIDFSPDVTRLTGTSICTSPSCTSSDPWLQATADIGTTNAYNAVPAPFWPWQTVTTPNGYCDRDGLQTACGIMGNTMIDLFGSTPSFATKWKIYVPLSTNIEFAKADNGGVPGYNLEVGKEIGKLDVRVGTKVPLPVAPHELNLMAVATVSNLPLELNVAQGLDAGGSNGAPQVIAASSQQIDEIFLGLRMDGNWFGDPGLRRVTHSDVNDAGFPIFVTVEDIPGLGPLPTLGVGSLSLGTGKGSYTSAADGGGTSAPSSAIPDAPFFSYEAAAGTLDATLWVDIGELWNSIARLAIKDAANTAGSVVPGWLAGLANYEARGHLLFKLVDIPTDGLAVGWDKGLGKLFLTASPILNNQRLDELFVDFQLRFLRDIGDSGCIICAGIFDIRWYYEFGWWFGIETLSLLLEDLKSVSIDPGIETIIDLDGHMVFHFRAGFGLKIGAGIPIDVLGTRILCICIPTITWSLILDPGFVSFDVLNWATPKIPYFAIPYPFHITGKWGFLKLPHGHFCLCADVWWVRLQGTRPGNWGLDWPIAFPPYVPFRGLDITGVIDGSPLANHVFMNPRIMLCAGSWENPTVFCYQIGGFFGGRLYPIEFIFAYAFIRYFTLGADNGKDHYHVFG